MIQIPLHHLTCATEARQHVGSSYLGSFGSRIWNPSRSIFGLQNQIFRDSSLVQAPCEDFGAFGRTGLLHSAFFQGAGALEAPLKEWEST